MKKDLQLSAAILEKYFDRLWPICRSITGNGLRESLKILSEIIPLQIHEVPTGRRVFDWEVPKEWNVSDAYILTPDNKKIASFASNNLHLVGYSVPLKKTMQWEELSKHLHTIPDLPDAIPYVTSYYKENWGFCISHREFLSLPKEGNYKVVIESSLEKGSMTYGDLVLKGESEEEVLFSTYVCHPSMANNELSGPLVTAFLYSKIAAITKRKYTYRFVFIPETIGAVNYLFDHGFYLKEKLHAGYVVTCVGDKGPFTYKRSRIGNSLADRVAQHVLANKNILSRCIDFDIGGSDERQYCSPGFNLPVGSLIRSVYHEYPEYHTSLDNKNFISFDAMLNSVETYFEIARVLELNDKYINTNPYGEPMLGKRGLYPSQGAQRERTDLLSNMLYLLNYADGEHDLIKIAEQKNKSVLEFAEVVDTLVKAGLLTVKSKVVS